MTFQRQNLNLLAARLRLLGELLERDGTTVWATTAAWQHGARAAVADPDSGGNRWWTDPDTGEVFPVPHDPTGDNATNPDPAADIHDRLLRTLTTIETTGHTLLDLLHAATPRRPITPARDRRHTQAQLIAEGWCTSCHRHDQHLTPIEVRPDGSRYYATMCRWCGSFTADYRRLPPLMLLELRHTGRRISVRDVQGALDRERDEQRASKKRRKGRAA